MSDQQFLARGASVRTSRGAIVMTFVRLSVCLSVRVGRACIVIILCILAQILVYDWTVQCSGHPDTKACPSTHSRIFPVPPGIEVGYGCAN